MRILHVFDIFSPEGGGTVPLLHDLSIAQARSGHEVIIYTSDFKLDKAYIASASEVKVYPFHSVSSLGRLQITPSLIQAAKQNLKGFDIIHMHCARSFQNIVIHHYARQYHIPYVVEHQGSLPRKAAGETAPKWLLRWLFDIIFGYRILNEAARIVLTNEFSVREYNAFGARNRKITVIPHYFKVDDFINLPPRGQFRSRYKISEKKIILFLGRINRIKGLDMLAESFSELSRINPNVVLVIAGPDDGYRTALEKLVIDLGLSNHVLFTGFISGQDKMAALVDADLLVQPSRYDESPLAPIEALLCGTPVLISSNTGGAEDILKMNAGYTVEFGKGGQFAPLVNSLLADPSEAKEKARRGNEYVRANLSLSKIVKVYESLYQDCLRETRLRV